MTKTLKWHFNNMTQNKKKKIGSKTFTPKIRRNHTIFVWIKIYGWKLYRNWALKMNVIDKPTKYKLKWNSFGCQENRCRKLVDTAKNIYFFFLKRLYFYHSSRSFSCEKFSFFVSLSHTLYFSFVFTSITFWWVCDLF